ncbi:ras-domain-containing protein [Gloeophyllum trabeum ATCC 11539]|uniref:Ras-domain-containing protein n=1 Tax=Gloeophyllum trabeum (strain ATCC 11539 / FP-39264 / Madison 617) TaxID=670483 RepID=S7QK62_GLOTA|nr:ras-domain-containing protein [Gloeophyllum trabeum ATCC 11539]EPQ59633.1 ras-domain-containing protein [Gloeophyllum trabeum ATCC 11539]
MDPYKRSRYEHGIDAKIVSRPHLTRVFCAGVGKTSLLRRYTQGKFDPKNTTSTTGAFFVTKKVDINGMKVRLQLWDTAGQERFRSMAPMYYRGANAALLLYDITNAASFDDVRGWLEELKKNCTPDLLIYIVGAKADLKEKRQVTSDLARLQLHNWFPPPRPPSPPTPPPQPSTFSYIRPRFTSFTSARSVPLNSPSRAKSPPREPSYIDAPEERSEATFGSRFGSHFGLRTGWNEIPDTNSNSLDEDEYEEEDEEWGTGKDMVLYEVSAKDDFGIQQLFDSVIQAIIERRDVIERENELKKRDSVFLSSSTPTWAAQSDDEDALEEKGRTTSSWSCCQT